MPNAVNEVTKRDLQTVTGLVELLREEVGQFLAVSSRPSQLPALEVREAMIELWRFVAGMAHCQWPRQCWPFLAKLEEHATRCELGSAVFGTFDASNWATVEWPSEAVLHWPSMLWELVNDFHTPRPLPADRTIQLESIQELDQQGLTDEQIAVVYGWYFKNGSPNVYRVRRHRSGELPGPEPTVLAGADDGLPREQPAMANMCEFIESLIARETPEAPPAPLYPPPSLETISELDKQQVSDTQIAVIFGWLDESGLPDVDRVRKSRKAELATT